MIFIGVFTASQFIISGKDVIHYDHDYMYIK